MSEYVGSKVIRATQEEGLQRIQSDAAQHNKGDQCYSIKDAEPPGVSCGHTANQEEKPKKYEPKQTMDAVS